MANVTPGHEREVREKKANTTSIRGETPPGAPTGETRNDQRGLFAPQEQMKRACAGNHTAVRRFLDDESPQIEACAKPENAEIGWSDEAGLNNARRHTRGHAPRR
jgi:hypothetical protein